MPSVQQREAEAAWKLFHKRPEVDWARPVKLKSPFPKKWGYAGKCITTYYSSDKWQNDRTFFERYYHDHKKQGMLSKGVDIWLPEGSQPWLGDKQPPSKIIRPPEAVAVLGFALGFDIVRPGQRKMGKLEPDKGALLVCAPDKKRVYVVEDNDVTALVWGPSLRVEARGLVG